MVDKVELFNTPGKISRAVSKRNKGVCVIPRCDGLPHGTWTNTCDNHYKAGLEWVALLRLPA